MIAGRVSIVVASYNHAGYLVTRMESLLAQTYPDIEILVLDDRSTDNSLEVLERYVGHPKITVIARPVNGGWVTTFNEGLARSTGEFVLFANCDDDCDPRLVSRLVDALTAVPTAGLAFCRSLYVDANNRVTGDDFSARPVEFQRRCRSDAVLTGLEMSRSLLHSCTIPNTGAALIRRSVFDAVGAFLPAYPITGDWEFYFRVAAKYDAVYIAEPLNRFRQHPAAFTRSTKRRSTHAEYLQLLLGYVRVVDLTTWQRMQYRARAISLWATHVISPSMAGVRDVPFHLRLVLKRDPAALWLVVPCLAQRVVQLLGKLATGRRDQPNAAA